jgi:hypothetical protein
MNILLIVVILLQGQVQVYDHSLQYIQDPSLAVRILVVVQRLQHHPTPTAVAGWFCSMLSNNAPDCVQPLGAVARRPCNAHIISQGISPLLCYKLMEHINMPTFNLLLEPLQRPSIVCSLINCLVVSSWGSQQLPAVASSLLVSPHNV